MLFLSSSLFFLLQESCPGALDADELATPACTPGWPDTYRGCGPTWMAACANSLEMRQASDHHL